MTQPLFHESASHLLQAPVRLSAADYCYTEGLPELTEGHYVAVNAERARAIASAYDALPALDTSPEVHACYSALANEVIAQYEWAIGSLGIHFQPWQQEGQPYANSAEMHHDVWSHNHLWFFTGGNDIHQYLAPVVYDGLTVNDLFRAVHDLYGHAAEGFQFGPRGEENAWIHHSMMFSAKAQRALTTETRGQNSWVNFGPFSHLPVIARPYAQQKGALLPLWACDWKIALAGK